MYGIRDITKYVCLCVNVRNKRNNMNIMCILIHKTKCDVQKIFVYSPGASPYRHSPIRIEIFLNILAHICGCSLQVLSLLLHVIFFLSAILCYTYNVYFNLFERRKKNVWFYISSCFLSHSKNLYLSFSLSYHLC